MTLLAPGFLFAALVGAAAIVVLHFIVTRQPRAGVLPTARFVPDMPATATARAARPSDLLLLLLRILLVLATGAALAKPNLKPSRGAEARVILTDLSRSARDTTAIRDSVRSLYRAHDALVMFDSSARVIGGTIADSIEKLRPSVRRGNMSAALIAALRAASGLRDRADSLELVVVSPFAAEEMDAATETVRKLWPGKARLVRVSAMPGSARTHSEIEVRGGFGDPLLVTAGLARRIPGASAVIVRDDVAAVSPPIISDLSRAVVEWPVTARPRGAVRRTASDTVGGVLVGNSLVVAAFERQWRYEPDSIRGAEIIARWIDGEPSALEWPVSGGCVRSVAIPVPSVGDIVVREDFIRLVGALSGECASRRSMHPAPARMMTALTGSGGLAPPEAFAPRGDVNSVIAPLLLALALALAVAELFLRRRAKSSSDVASSARSEHLAA